ALQKNASNKKIYHHTKKFYSKTEKYIHLTYNERKQFISDIAKQIASWGFTRLFAECIDKTKFNNSKTKQTVNEQAFEQLISRFEQYLQIISKAKDQKLYGLLVHDNNETVSKKLTQTMKEFHKKGTIWTNINNIIETPLFVDSELTGMIQLADVCGYALRRFCENGEKTLYDHIIKRADRKKNRIVGVRHFTDKTICTCDICSNR
ncbi:DUF3800 domain-containing protein, partial [Patescibacteria group bacterium]|nr:DUF3800 domain-containing protein [Patescibacteria group bacterium]